MPREAKGARLYADRRRGQWVIRDGARFIRTGCTIAEREQADKALAVYIAEKYEPAKRGGSADETSLIDILLAYSTERGPHVRAPETLGHAIKPLARFWGDKSLQDVSAVNCRAYAAARSDLGRSDGTTRRELSVLQAAIRYWHQEYGPLRSIPAVLMPPAPPPRDRWLTRQEAARLLLGALGWRAVSFDLATRCPVKWERSVEAKEHKHIARFILIGLRTGTRSDAIVRLQWMANTDGGWVDCERGVIYRKAATQAETNKRQPPVKLNPRLVAMLKIWREKDLKRNIRNVVSHHGGAVKKIRTAWARAVEFAGLDDAVTPHVLRHTRATWLMQAGVPIHEAAGSLGMSAQILERVYGHHHPDHQSRAAAV